MIEFLFLAVGLAIGFGLGFFYTRSKSGNSAPNAGGGISASELNTLRSDKERIAVEKGELEGRLNKSLEVFEEQKKQLAEKEERLEVQTGRVERLEAEKTSLEKKLEEQLAQIEELNERFKVEFQNLANEILKQNTKEFTDSNKKQIGDILNPLKERIESFEKKVNDVYSDESKSRSELKGEVKSLIELNRKISEEASNLTNALKGDTKKQGAWGELILEKILENSGLENGVEYETQVSNQTEEGIFRPDVLVKLPDNKFVVIDSKVSLTAYEAYVNEEHEEDAQRYLQQHIASVRQHVKGLSSKKYQEKTTGESLDFVLMFVPIEAGFSEALKNDRDLYDFAWENRIVIVSPTTLLATLRTIASVWKQEKQNRNVYEIARLAGTMYDKFCGFIGDMGDIDRHLDQSKKSFEQAMRKLNEGPGNLVTTSEKIKRLGAKASKQLPHDLVDQSEEA